MSAPLSFHDSAQTGNRRQLRAELPVIDRLSAAHFDLLVHDWNRLERTARDFRLAGCRRKGHDWVGSPLPGVDVCRRCLQYRPATKADA